MPGKEHRTGSEVGGLLGAREISAHAMRTQLQVGAHIATSTRAWRGLVLAGACLVPVGTRHQGAVVLRTCALGVARGSIWAPCCTNAPRAIP